MVYPSLFSPPTWKNKEMLFSEKREGLRLELGHA